MPTTPVSTGELTDTLTGALMPPTDLLATNPCLPQCSDPAHFPAPAREALSCYGDLLRLGYYMPRDRLAAEAAAKGVTLVRRAVFGVGDEIVHPYLAER